MTPQRDATITTPIIPDFETASYFLSRIDGMPDMPRSFNLIGEKATRVEGFASEKHGQLSALQDVLTKAQNEGRAGFFFVQSSDLKGTKIANVRALNCWAADFDFKSAEGFDENENPQPFTLEQLLEALPLEPHIVVFTGNGFHAYYLAAEGSPIDSRRPIQKQIAAKMKPFGPDPASLHLLRLPGTYNRKFNQWKPVRIVYETSGERYTLEQMQAAFPPIKPRRARGQVESYADEIELNGYTVSEVYALTHSYCSAAFQGITEGNRHSTLLTALPTIVGRSKWLGYDDMLQIIYETLCVPSGYGLNEATRDLDSAINSGLFTDPRLPKKTPLTRSILKKVQSLPLATQSGLSEQNERLRAEIRACIEAHRPPIEGEPQNNELSLFNVSVGVGKTQAAIDVLNELLSNPEVLWPRDESGKFIQIVFCVDTHEQAAEVRDKLKPPTYQGMNGKQHEHPTYKPRIYKGRSAENCPEINKIKGSPKSGQYCAACPYNPQNEGENCAFWGQRLDALRAPLVIKPKAAVLADLEHANLSQILIIDESITNHLIHTQTYDEKRLSAYMQHLSLVADQPGVAECITWLRELMTEANKLGVKDSSVLKTSRPPELSPELIDEIESFKTVGGELWKADVLLSLLQRKTRVRVSRERVTITYKNHNAEALLKNCTVINLDATPAKAVFNTLEHTEHDFKAGQNVQYWQHVGNKFGKRELENPKQNDKANDLIKQILGTLPESSRAAIFTYKRDENELSELLSNEIASGRVQIGVYGRDNRGVNKFESCDALILKGAYSLNIDAVRDMAAVLNVKSGKLQEDLNRAEIAQTIGRLRAVRAAEKKNVFILTQNALALDSEPKVLADWFKTTNFRGSARLKPSADADRLILHTNNISLSTDFEPIQTTSGLSPSLIPEIYDLETQNALVKLSKKQGELFTFIQSTIDKLGFFHNDFVLNGSHFESLPGAPTMSKATLKRYMAEIERVSALKSEHVKLAEHSFAAVYGSPEAAKAYKESRNPCPETNSKKQSTSDKLLNSESRANQSARSALKSDCITAQSSEISKKLKPSSLKMPEQTWQSTEREHWPNSDTSRLNLKGHGL